MQEKPAERILTGSAGEDDGYYHGRNYSIACHLRGGMGGKVE